MYSNDWASIEKGRVEIYSFSATRVISSAF